MSLISFCTPNIEKVGSILVSACLYVCIGHRDIVLKLRSCLDSSWKNSRHIFFFALSPLAKLRLFEKQGMKFCKCSISKSY